MTERAEIYCGRSLQDAFRAIAHDLGGMRAMLNVAIGPESLIARYFYVRNVSSCEQHLTNLADCPAPRAWRRAVLRRTNEQLYDIHLLVQLPLWQYVIEEDPLTNTITAIRTPKRQI